MSFVAVRHTRNTGRIVTVEYYFYSNNWFFLVMLVLVTSARRLLMRILPSTLHENKNRTWANLAPDFVFVSLVCFEKLRCGRGMIRLGFCWRYFAHFICSDVFADFLVTGIFCWRCLLFQVSVDGKRVSPQGRLVYHGHMLSNMPNAFAIQGYINSSWTLKVDLVLLRCNLIKCWHPMRQWHRVLRKWVSVCVKCGNWLSNFFIMVVFSVIFVLGVSADWISMEFCWLP